jgi:hypothetical protein
LLACGGLARFDEVLAGEPSIARPAVTRFADVMKTVLAIQQENRFHVLRAGGAPVGDRMLAQGTTEEVDAVTAALEQLRKEEPLRVRLQCSWVTVSKAVAQAHGLKLAEVTVVDENAVRSLLREATKTKGALVNMPEVVAAPLAPFVVEPAGKAAAAAAPEQTLRLRGEMVPLSENEVGVSMHLVRGALPADRTAVPPRSLRQLGFRLEAGKTAMSMVLTDGDTATVLVVRCLDASPAPLAKPEPNAKPTAR